MSWLWTGEAMVEAMGGRPVGDLPAGVGGLSIDTRTLRPGEAFFAIKGDRFDGHDFASAAIAAGAALLVVSEAKLPALGRLTVPLIVVEDVLEALGRLAVAARARSRARIVAVTGSVGKTTTKEMLRRALQPFGLVHASAASFNNHWGVPLTLARMPEAAAFSVFEIGMNHSGEIRPLARLVAPHVAIVTAIGAAHLGNFRHLGEIAAAKAEIFEGVVDGGAALINRDSEKVADLKKAAAAAGVGTVLTFGEHRQADVRLIACETHEDHSLVCLAIDGAERTVTIGAPGRHLVQNALAVLGAVRLCGADLDEAGATLVHFTTEKGRGARHRLAIGGGAVTLIDESYNANPSSMEAALALLGETPVGDGGRRIAVLGDMLELGRFSSRLHGALAKMVETAGVDILYIAGEEMLALQEALAGGALAVRHEADAGALGVRLARELRAGDVVMIKASFGIGFGKIVEMLLDTFPNATSTAQPQEPAQSHKER